MSALFRLKWLTTGILLLLPLMAYAQRNELELAVFLIPEELKEGAKSVVRYYDLDYVVHSESSATQTSIRAVTILEAGSGENELTLNYDSDRKITELKATLYDPMGQKVREVKKSEIVDVMAVGGGQFYTDSRLKHIELEYPTYPYTVVYEVTTKYSGFGMVYFPYWMPQGLEQATQSATFTATIPTNNEFLYDAYQLPEPEKTLIAANYRYRWTVEDLQAVKSEPYQPAYGKILPNVKTQLKRFELGNGQQGSYASWLEFGQIFRSLMKDRNALPEALIAELQQLTAGLGNNREKIKILYHFMQDRMRYVGVQLGIGGWQPFSAAYVESNRYGDCKALSNYMMSILEVAGVESYPTLIFSGNKPTYSPHEHFPTDAFNHVVLYVPEEDMYLECTSNYVPAGYMYEQTLDRKVVWITPEGGKLASTPKINPADNGHLRTQRIKILEDGSAELKLHTRYVGAKQEDYRYLAKSMSDAEFKERLEKDEEIPDVTGTHYSLSVSRDEAIVDLNYTTTVPRYARKMGKRFFIPLNKLFALDVRPPKLEKRVFPVVNEKGRFYVDSVYLELPEGLSLEALGDLQTDIVHEAGEYHATLTQTGNQLLWTRTMKVIPVELPAAAYEGFRSFFLEAGKADRRQLVLKSVTKR